MFLVHSWPALRQEGMVEGSRRGKLLTLWLMRKQREKGITGKEDVPFQVMPLATHLFYQTSFLNSMMTAPL